MLEILVRNGALLLKKIIENCVDVRSTTYAK